MAPGTTKSDAIFEVGFWRAIDAAGLYADKAMRLQITMDDNRRASGNDEGLGNDEHERCVAVLVIGRSVVVVASRDAARVMVVVMQAAPVMVAAAKLDVAGKRVCEMGMMVRVFDVIQYRYEGLAGQNECEQHAEYCDQALEVTIPWRHCGLAGHWSHRLAWAGDLRNCRRNRNNISVSMTVLGDIHPNPADHLERQFSVA